MKQDQIFKFLFNKFVFSFVYNLIDTPKCFPSQITWDYNEKVGEDENLKQ